MMNTQNNTENTSAEPSLPKNDAHSDENIVLEEIHKSSHDKQDMTVNAHGKTKYKKSDKKHHHHHHHHHHRHHHHGSKHRKKMLRRVLIGILIFLLVAILGLFIAFQVMRYLGKKELLSHNENVSINTINNAHSEDDGQTILYNGDTYRFNKDLISIVIMGVDKSELNADVYGDAGQADAIYIFTYDTKSGKCCLLPVSRDTMTDVRVYSMSGGDMGLENMQLCLSYAYGDGKESSCTNTLESLSRIFYNIPFNTYVSLNWDSIGPLNDVLGGIDLTALEDIPIASTSIKKGDKVTLLGQDAWAYIKYRDTKKLESNPDRLNRQKQYLSAYISKLIPLAQNDITIISDLYDTATDYMYTNVTRNKAVYIASEILPNIYSSKDINFVSIDGEIKQGEKYAEFYPDETSLYEAILKVFYVKEIK